ncbi:hypothetical protein yaldo0001_25190 [Yersinia aldovae ATCC 35236]|nr:hypothetical protein yaldo0001_25190 [Yersinia aldovae ATCC 35236]
MTNNAVLFLPSALINDYVEPPLKLAPPSMRYSVDPSVATFWAPVV